MKVRMYIFTAILIVASIFSAANRGRSEEPGLLTETAVQNIDKEIHNEVERLRVAHLIRELQLTEEKAGRIVEKMRHARSLKKEYLLQRHSIETRLDTLLNYPAPNQTEISTTLQKLEMVKNQYYQQLMQTDKDLLQILNPEEQAKYVLFQKTFNRKLKKIILNIRKQNINPPRKQNHLLRRDPAESVIRQSD